MRFYADHPDRRASQLIGDVAALAWCVAALVVGPAVHDAISELGAPASSVEQTGDSLATSLGDVADTLGDVPLIGDSVGEALERAAEAAGGLRDAGASAGQFAERTAVLMGWLIPILALGIIVVGWIRPRVAWVREADDARAALRLDDGVELLAGRALAKARLPRLAAYGPHLPQRWKAGDPEAAETLARAELDRLGLEYSRAP